jgi:hypothetical protein
VEPNEWLFQPPKPDALAMRHTRDDSMRIDGHQTSPHRVDHRSQDGDPNSTLA